MSSLSFMEEMRRMRAARLKRSNITKPQGTLLTSTEKGHRLIPRSARSLGRLNLWDSLSWVLNYK